MPISDNYVVRYLLQGTRATMGAIVWREKEPTAYVASIKGIEAEVESIPSRSGARLRITLSCDTETIRIEEPLSSGFFKSKYENSDMEQLARMMKELGQAIVAQCVGRANRSADAMRTIRESMYRRLIGATGQEGD